MPFMLRRGEKCMLTFYWCAVFRCQILHI
ncbi:rCG49584 [Rattus norvegicus]|uniref:RCG49584 n=1 Tax=Rattus norvegicus TaxID=10116 RepID=A6J3K6_RAT|nr:rCG49584 [Rattus norvegicus]